MHLNEAERNLLSHPSGSCRLNVDVDYILYVRDNWEEVQKFCLPFSIEKSKINTESGRAVIDLPSGNETFEYGMILVRLGTKRILLFTPSEFMEIFSFLK